MDVVVAGTADEDPASRHLLAREAFAEPLVTVERPGNEVVERERSLTPTEGAARLVAQSWTSLTRPTSPELSLTLIP